MPDNPTPGSRVVSVGDATRVSLGDTPHGSHEAFPAELDFNSLSDAELDDLIAERRDQIDALEDDLSALKAEKNSRRVRQHEEARQQLRDAKKQVKDTRPGLSRRPRPIQASKDDKPKDPGRTSQKLKDVGKRLLK